MSEQSNNQGRAYEFICLQMLSQEINKIRKAEIEINSAYHAAEHARAKRFIRKAGMNRKDLNYFFTITRDSKLFSDGEDWMRSLCRWFANNAFRYGVKIMGGFEFGDDNSRLHFHAVAHIPEGFFSDGELKKVSRYSEKEHKWRNVLECVELRDKFGINEFEYISSSDEQSFLNVLNYVCSYASKDGGKMYYSRGLPDHIETFINAEDIFFVFDDGITKYRLRDGWKNDKINALLRFKRLIKTDELPFEDPA